MITVPSRPDFTKLGWFDKTLDNCTVTSIPAGATPKFIKVRLPGSDGAIIDAWWTGIPDLAVASTCSLRYSAGLQAQYTVSGGGTGTAPPSSHTHPSSDVWPFDNVLTVSTTNASADFATIQAANDAANPAATIIIDGEMITESPTLTVQQMTLMSLGLTAGIDDGRVTLTPDSIIYLIDINLWSTSQSEPILLTQQSMYGRGVIAFASYSHAGITSGYRLQGLFATLKDCSAETDNAGAGPAYGVYLEPDTTIEATIDGGVYLSQNGDIYAEAGATVHLNGPQLTGATPTAGPGSFDGWYLDANYNKWCWNGSAFVEEDCNASSGLIYMPLTGVVAGEPVLVWDDDNNLIPTGSIY